MITEINTSKSPASIKISDGEKYLTDKYGRYMRKLRISLTDACNFRCSYCMPLDTKFSANPGYLSPINIYEITKNLVELGVTQIRVTGGEPTLRREFSEIMKLIGQLNIQKFGITSNGWNLDKYFKLFKEINCNHLNISLDSLDESQFKKITHTNFYKKTLANILNAKSYGFKVKINVVLLKGLNDDQIVNFVKFSQKYDIEVRFLELMKIGTAISSHNSRFMSAQECIKLIKQEYDIFTEKTESDSTSFNFRFKSLHNAKIGFIASESKPFCDSCSRLRLTPSGKLNSCLMSSYGLNLKNIPTRMYPNILRQIMGMKPTYRLEKIEKNMHEIGG